jgi:hypothetical protein
MNSNATASGASPAGQSTPLDLNKLVGQFVQLRDHKRALEAEHKAQLKPYTKLLDEIGSKLLTYMQQMGVDNVSTPGGSAYQIVKQSATIRDGTAFRAFVVETGSFELVDWRANAPAVFDYITENEGRMPPGVNASTYVSVGIRRPNEQE